MPPTWDSDLGRSDPTARAAISTLRHCRRRFLERRLLPNSLVASEPTWKDRYAALESRLADAKTALDQTRKALHAAQERDQATRATLAKVRERLHWHER